MAIGGGKPGIVSKLKVAAISPDGKVLFQFEDTSDTNYFKENNEYVAFFLPAPAEYSGSDGEKQKDS